MFTGIIERLGRIESASADDGSLTVRVATGLRRVRLGESIAVDGVCLTAAEYDAAGVVTFYISPETLARSNLGRLEPGRVVNLERALRVGDRLSGHLVQGHVDGQGVLSSLGEAGGAHLIELDLPQALARHCVHKGSIALDGISLTINSIAQLEDGGIRIGLTIIPHTWEHTNLHTARLGDNINVEVDVIAKHVEQLCQAWLPH